MLKRISLLISGCALGALASGCFVTTDSRDAEPIGSGDMTMLWTVDNTVDEGACFYYAADPMVGMDLELVVLDDVGRTVTVDYIPCEDFGATLSLRAGWYDAEVTMVDPRTDDALSTTLPLYDIRVFAGEEVQLDVDFPASSFLYY
jgi:hypothetical protein